MATGKRAFEGSSAASIISAIMRDEPRVISELAPLTPPALERVVKGCLVKDPEDRLQTAHDVKLQLQWIAEAGPRSGIATTPAKRRPTARQVWGMSLAALAAVSLGVAAWYLKPTETQHLMFTPVTFKPMILYKAAFAPDGKTIVLSAGMGGVDPRVYVIRPEYPDPQPISDPGVHLLSVSSRGELAVLTKTRMPRGAGEIVGTLARMPLGGGAPREILEDVREADWSPDGTQLAVLRKVGSEDRLEYPVGTVIANAGEFLSDISVSPRGDAVAYIEHSDRRGKGGAINVVDFHGQKRVLSAGYQAASGIAWAADGREIYFSATYGGSEMAEVFAVSLTGKRRYASTSAGGVTIRDVSREGRWLATREDSRTALMVHKPEWNADRDLAWLDESGGGCLSQDGTLLAFTESSSAVGDTPVMCLRKTDGSPVVRLGEGSVWDLSKDGKSVLALLPSEPPQVVIQPTGAGGAVKISRGSIERYLIGGFFPGGNKVIFLGNVVGKREQYFLQGVSEPSPRALTKEGSLFAVFSPDGRYVAANGFEHPWMLYPTDGSAPRPFPVLTSRDFPLRWNPDGRSILVLDPSVPLGPVESVDIATGRRTPFIATLPVNQEGLVHRLVTAITDDDRCYAYSASWSSSTLFRVEAER